MESTLNFEIQNSLHSVFCDPRALEACWSGRCVTSLEVAASEVQAFKDDFWVASCPASFPETHISHRGLQAARELMWPEPQIPNPKSHAPSPKPQTLDSNPRSQALNPTCGSTISSTSVRFHFCFSGALGRAWGARDQFWAGGLKSQNLRRTSAKIQLNFAGPYHSQGGVLGAYLVRFGPLT